MKTILIASLLVASPLAFAQPANPPADRAAKPPSCDQLAGMEKEACLKQGGTVKANNAGSGSSSAPPAPAVGSHAKKGYTKPAPK
ncbi:MAG: hypothetical protein QOD26_1144 [Betaproteobacteria bacterium]|jgi:hypothetical protein|nr:hypothetical protein [Betaproteobacteria bacterium]